MKTPSRFALALAAVLLPSAAVLAQAPAPQQPAAPATRPLAPGQRVPLPSAVPQAPPAPPKPDYPTAVWEGAHPGNFAPWTGAEPRTVDTVVIHDIEGPGIAAVRWFQNPKAGASSHYVIDGETGKVWQMVPEKDVAWHAGNRNTNQRSVGIEHHGYAYRPGFYDLTLYEASARLVRDITTRHNIPRDRTHIIGHHEVPDPRNPGQFGGASHHTDPGPYWDWDTLMALVRNDAAPSAATNALVLRPGQKGQVTLALTNRGDDAWPLPGGAPGSPDPAVDTGRIAFAQREPVYLGLWPQPEGLTIQPLASLWDRTWTSPRLVGLPQGTADVAPGATGTFAFVVQAPPAAVGTLTQRFRLVKMPPAPRSPVPFGPEMPVTVRVEPWEYVTAAAGSVAGATAPAIRLFTPGEGWKPKGATFWRAYTAAEVKGAEAQDGARAAQWDAVLPMGGEWDVYVRWPAAPNRTPRAVYEVYGSNGARIGAPEADQRKAPAGSGGWHRLGRYSFSTVGAKDRFAGVRLSAAAPGVAVADAVRFVGPFPAGE